MQIVQRYDYLPKLSSSEPMNFLQVLDGAEHVRVTSAHQRRLESLEVLKQNAHPRPSTAAAVLAARMGRDGNETPQPVSKKHRVTSATSATSWARERTRCVRGSSNLSLYNRSFTPASEVVPCPPTPLGNLTAAETCNLLGPHMCVVCSRELRNAQPDSEISNYSATIDSHGKLRYAPTSDEPPCTSTALFNRVMKSREERLDQEICQSAMKTRRKSSFFFSGLRDLNSKLTGGHKEEIVQDMHTSRRLGVINETTNRRRQESYSTEDSQDHHHHHESKSFGLAAMSDMFSPPESRYGSSRYGGSFFAGQKSKYLLPKKLPDNVVAVDLSE